MSGCHRSSFIVSSFVVRRSIQTNGWTFCDGDDGFDDESGVERQEGKLRCAVVGRRSGCVVGRMAASFGGIKCGVVVVTMFKVGG